MARYTESSCKKCRRYGSKLFLKGDRCMGEKCAFQKRPNIPGQHGPTSRRGKLTDYGSHLIEKQKARFHYGIMESQFSRYYVEASGQRKIPSGDRLLQLLELRLDNVIYRLGLASSRPFARQMVLHRKVKVNNRYVNIPSFRVKPGDVVTFKDEFLSNVYVKSSLEKGEVVPTWLSLNLADKKAEVLSLPTKEEIKTPFNEQLIVEFYSK